ncbi:hypothetical protein C2G38_2102490 [Gigaspora rosea]|uniref:Uncharacterized protein n=1 Tax=Gigaspora rosea TaxID=44941 RepID=A0A397UNP4_9GLOM|nr:hypothetical protein C2G38_2102490 [Gigaspora rosea]
MECISACNNLVIRKKYLNIMKYLLFMRFNLENKFTRCYQDKIGDAKISKGKIMDLKGEK